MRLLKILLVVGVAAVGYKQWNQYQHNRELAALAQQSPGGFIPVSMPSQAPTGHVYILAPLNCPSPEARRADELAARLHQLGIPVKRGSGYSLQFGEPTEQAIADAKRTSHILEGPIPAVFVNGMGKSNPTLEDVLAEYRRTQ